MNIQKIEAATRTQTYQEYAQLLGAALARAALGDPTAMDEYLELQKEQAEFVRKECEK